MRKLFLFTVLFFIYSISIAQNLSIEWSKNFGTSGNESHGNIVTTEDGGYMAFGITNQGNVDYWLMKLDVNGNKLWDKTYGSASPDLGKQILRTHDNGYLLIGYIYDQSPPNYADIYIIKVDTNGNIVWSRTYGSYNYDYAMAAENAEDNGFVIASTVHQNNGDVTSGRGLWIFKIDENGEIVWQNSILEDLAIPTSIKKTSSNNYVITNNQNVYLIDSSGNLLQHYPVDNSDMMLTNTEELSDGSFLMLGVTDTELRGIFWYAKLNADFELVWEKTFERGFYGNSYIELQNNLILIGGYAFRDPDNEVWDLDNIYYLMDLDGNILKHWLFGGDLDDGRNHLYFQHKAVQGVDGGIVAFSTSKSSNGDVPGNNGGEDWLIYKLNFDLMETLDNNINQVNVYPNPITNKLYFNEELKEVRIYDLNGKLLKSSQGLINQIDLTELHSGVYILKAKQKDGKLVSKKIIKK